MDFVQEEDDARTSLTSRHAECNEEVSKIVSQRAAVSSFGNPGMRSGALGLQEWWGLLGPAVRCTTLAHPIEHSVGEGRDRIQLYFAREV